MPSLNALAGSGIDNEKPEALKVGEYNLTGNVHENYICTKELSRHI
jgi:hypothetical protein